MKRASLLAIVLAAGLGACATAPTRPPRPTATGAAVDPATAESLLGRMRSAAGERQSLRGVAQLSFDGAAGSVRSKQAIVVELPGKLRIEVLGFLSQALAVLVTDGQEFELFKAEDRSRRRGEVYPGLLMEVGQIDLTPEEGAALLLGSPPEMPDLRLASAVGLSDGGVGLDRVDSRGVLRERLDFAADGRVQRVERYEVNQRLVWSVDYRDYRDAGGIDFAHTLVLWFPSSQTTVELVFKQVELNPTLPSGVFTLQRASRLEPAGEAGHAG
ncbi:hypothetical protein MYXO_00223 [Myxococcaceae bacterium]|nr:hypothetical protein MYXO_00223 [Myxococcaceae bacterium]